MTLYLPVQMIVGVGGGGGGGGGMLRLLVVAVAAAVVVAQSQTCSSIDESLQIPCLCQRQETGIHINCDNVAFSGDFPLLPYRYCIYV